jgi:uncharacterized protein
MNRAGILALVHRTGSLHVIEPFRLAVDASRGGETRDAVIGMDRRWNLLLVVHVQIEDDRILIISARRAMRTERAQYED